MIARIHILALVILTAGVSFGQTPLPGDLVLTPPPAGIAQNIAAFAGAWKGMWGGSLPSALVVEQINTNGTAQVVYSWGDLPVIGIKAGWTRLTGAISKDKLHLATTGGAIIDFELEQNGNLSGQYERVGAASYIEMQRIPSNDPSTIVTNAQKAEIQWKEIWISEHSQVGPTAGKTLKLQMTIYPASTPGKHPVVIFNHGSTGPGMVPASLVYRGGIEETFFRSLGYIEVVPMRKGRGDSEGPNVEENDLLPTAIGLDSAVEDLQTVVEYLKG